ncbi:uncharacterized protein V6R79_021717 [Siganus canaliculatus]
MMVVHMVPGAHYPAATQTAGSTRTIDGGSVEPCCLLLSQPLDGSGTLLLYISSRQRNEDIVSPAMTFSQRQHLRLRHHRSVTKPLVRRQQADGSSHKWLSGMSSCSDVPVHLICSSETAAA